MSLSRCMYTVITLACLAKFCDATGSDENLDVASNATDLDLFTQFFDWFDTIKMHLTHTEAALNEYGVLKLNLPKEHMDIFNKNKEAILAHYRNSVAVKVLPMLLESMGEINTDMKTESPEKKSKWRLFGTSVKLLIGITLMHGGATIDSFNELLSACKGVDDTFMATRDVHKDTGLSKLTSKLKKMFRTKMSNFKAEGVDDMKFREKIEGNLLALDGMKRKVLQISPEDYANGNAWELPAGARQAFIHLRGKAGADLLRWRQDAYKTCERLAHKTKSADVCRFISAKLSEHLFKTLKWNDNVCSPFSHMYNHIRTLETVISKAKEQEKSNRKALIRRLKALEQRLVLTVD